MVEDSEMITSGLSCKDHIPFGRFAFDVHSYNKTQDNETKSLSEGVGNISIYDSRSQISETWYHRVTSTGSVEELYSREKTVVLSSTCGSVNGASRIIKSYTVQSPIHQVFWCSFLLPSNEVNTETGSVTDDEVQTGFCVVESNCITVVSDSGAEHHVTLPFHIFNAWPLERGILFQRALQKSSSGGSVSTTLPMWFSMLHPLADLSPVICRCGTQLSYITLPNQHIVYVSDDASPYLAVIYDADTKLHSMYLIRRTMPEEEKTYTELNMVTDSSWHHKHSTVGSLHTGVALTPGATGFLTLSSVLSPAAVSMSPRMGSTLGTPSLRRHNVTHSPHLNRLNPTLSMNSPSLSSMHHLSAVQRHVTAASPSISASVAHSSFTSTGNHQLLSQDLNMPLDMLEPIRPDVCLQHVWTDQFSKGKACRIFMTTDQCGQKYLCMLIPCSLTLRCIKISVSHSATESLIFGNAVNISAQDACPAPSLNMMLVLDMQSNMHLYSGPTQISLLYIPRISFGAAHSLSTTPVRPTRSSIRASSRPGSAKGSANTAGGVQPIIFNTSQEEANWSPVQLELNDSTNLLVQGADELPERAVESLHSVTKRTLVLGLSNGQLCSTELPPLCTDSAVLVCLQALSAHLPSSVVMRVIPHWYLLNQAAGADAGSELDRFLKYMVENCGLPSDSNSNASQPGSPSQSKKRAKTMSQATDSHFDLLISKSGCDVYRRASSLLGIVVPPHPLTEPVLQAASLMLDEELAQEKKSAKESKVKRSVQIANECQRVDSQYPLANHIYTVFIVLHLCYEEMKLNQAFVKRTGKMAEMLLQLSTCLKLSQYTMIYLKDFTYLSSIDLVHWRSITIHSKVWPPTWFPMAAKSIPELLIDLLETGKPAYPVYYLRNTTHRIECLIKLYTMYSTRCTNYTQLQTEFLQALPTAGHCLSEQTSQEELICAALDGSLYTEEMMLLYMSGQGIDQLTIDSLPFACSLLLYEAIYRCQCEARTSWPASALKLIGRQDIAALSSPSLIPSSAVAAAIRAADVEAARAMAQPSVTTNTSKLKQLNGMEVLDNKVLKMRWSADLRLEEVKRCLNSSQPVKITIQQKPEVSDHQFIEQKQRHLLALCQRTMALSIGRGMLTLRSHEPVLTDSVHIPILSLSGKSYPTQSSVELSSDSQGQTATRLSVWPAFHNGVAAGLCLDKEAEVDTSWILYNRPKVTEKDEMNQISEHAGFLLALGMNGYLNNLARLSLHDYLVKGHEMTAVGILLGISVSMKATMDIATVRLLTIHTPSLLPPSSTRLDIAHNTKIAALIGLGLVYYCSTHRHIAGVLLHEIDHSPDIVSKGVTDDRESYSLAAGLALGMVMMGKGADMIGLHDLNIANRLSLLMTGGHRSADMSKDSHGSTVRAGSEQVCEGELINVDVTSAGATLALGLTYFNTRSNTVRDWLKLPHSQYLLESIRPDLLQLRVLSHALVMWDSVLPTEDWVNSYLPSIVALNSFKSASSDTYDGIDYETHSQAYCYIVSGGCFAVGLKFAGSCNKSAYDTLLSFTGKFVAIYQKPLLVEQSGRHVLENALCTCLLSLAMVMSGSGDLQVLRLCRYLRARIAVPLVTYGSHMAIHMALALLFLGSGRYTLSSKPETLPLLICAFFPRFPVHSNDNRYHLQALRHLYVQAVEPRLVFPVDIDTGEACYVPLQVTLKATSYYDKHTYVTYAPNILPDLDSIEKIEICDSRYWPMRFTSENKLRCIRKLLRERGALAVKRRSGHFPYSLDPRGVFGAMTRAVLFSSEKREGVRQDAVVTPQLYFMSKEQVDERSFLYIATRETVSTDRSELLPVYHRLYQIVSDGEYGGRDLQQLSLLLSYMRLSSKSVISKDLAEITLLNVREENTKRLSCPSVFARLNQLLEYCTEGKFPTNEDILKHLAFHSDIRHGSIRSIADLNMPVLLAKLHLTAEISVQLLATAPPKRTI